MESKGLILFLNRHNCNVITVRMTVKKNVKY